MTEIDTQNHTRTYMETHKGTQRHIAIHKPHEHTWKQKYTQCHKDRQIYLISISCRDKMKRCISSFMNKSRHEGRDLAYVLHENKSIFKEV